jgi:hypothetical protein
MARGLAVLAATCILVSGTAAGAVPAAAVPDARDARAGGPVLSARGAKVVESKRRVRIPLRLSPPASGPVAVTWSLVGGSATLGSDLRAAEGTATIPRGGRGTTITVRVRDDAIAENNEKFYVVLRASGAQVRTPRVPVVIRDDRTDAAVRELRGPVTITKSYTDGFNYDTWTLTLDFAPVSPDPAVGGDWPDSGAGTWALTGWSNHPGSCGFPTKVYSGRGTLSAPGVPTTADSQGTGFAVLRDFRPRQRKGSPELEVAVAAWVTQTTHEPASGGGCTSTTTGHPEVFQATIHRDPGPDALPPGTNTGKTPTTRGVAFDYDSGPLGRGSPQLTVSGALFPVR